MANTVIDDGGEVGLTPLDHFLQRAMLVASADALDPSADAITLMTLHNAKGLEYPVVFLTGLEDGLFPLSQSFDDPPKLEEERRLFYVGITRAQEKLLASDDFAKLFDRDRCFAYIMSVDIRKSTDLMLKATEPERFAVEGNFTTATLVCGAQNPVRTVVVHYNRLGGRRSALLGRVVAIDFQ